MSQNLPAPLVAADVDLRGLEWMPLFGARLFTSVTWLNATADGKVAALRLWWHAYANEVPAASLPDEDALLAEYAGYGVAVKAWRKVRDQALRGWVKCSDGRLYHPLLASEAPKAWKLRQRSRKKQKEWRDRHRDGDVTVTRPVTTPVTTPVTPPVTLRPTGQDRTGQDNKKEPPLPPTGGKAVVDVFLKARRHHWPHEGDERLVLLTLEAQADQYIADGASTALIGEVMEKAMSQMAQAGKGPPMNLRFCHRSMADAIVATKRPPPTNGHAANGYTPPAKPERSPTVWRRRLDGWLADKMWFPSWLIDDCPTELLDEYATALNAKPPIGYKFSQYYIDRQPPPKERDRTFETP